MDKTIEQLLKSFGHIAREVQIYILSGCVVLLDLLFLDWRYNRLAVSHGIEFNARILFVLGVVAYVTGNASLGFFCGLDNSTIWIVRKWRKWRGKNLDESPYLLWEVNAFKSDQASYTYFVERYSLLRYMRGAMSVAFLIASGLNGIVWHRTPGSIFSLIGLSTAASFIAGVCLFVLAQGTGRRMAGGSPL